jgi:hypothetical protein
MVLCNTGMQLPSSRTTTTKPFSPKQVGIGWDAVTIYKRISNQTMILALRLQKSQTSNGYKMYSLDPRSIFNGKRIGLLSSQKSNTPTWYMCVVVCRCPCAYFILVIARGFYQ